MQRWQCIRRYGYQKNGWKGKQREAARLQQQFLSPLSELHAFIYRSQLPLFPIVMDGWMKEGGGGGNQPLEAQVSSLSPSFFLQSHLTLCPLSPFLAPSLPSLTIMSPSSPALPSRLALHRNGRERRETVWLAPVHLLWLLDQIIRFCLRIEDNCSLYSVPSKCMILTPRSQL